VIGNPKNLSQVSTITKRANAGTSVMKEGEEKWTRTEETFHREV
jgi:hypothetical protein